MLVEVNHVTLKVSNFDNIHYVGVNAHCDRYKSDFIIQKLYKNPSETNTELPDVTIQSISDYLIMKSKLTDFNIPFVKELVIISTFSCEYPLVCKRSPYFST